MKYVKVINKHAQTLKRFLESNGLLDVSRKVAKDGEYVLFPVKKEFKQNFDFNISFEDLNTDFNRKKSYDELLREKLGSKADLVRHSFDVVGSIAVLEIPKEIDEYSKIIGEIFLKTHNNIRTVVKKVGGHKGEFRIQDFEVIAGENNLETVYIENGCRFKLDISKVYFSPRLGTERLRIASQVKDGESVLVMFSGYSPYPITILKHSNPSKVFAVELNPEAHKYALINKKLNHIGDELSLINGDVVVEVPKLVESYGKFDRILMPLPKTGNSFLKTAFKAVKPGGIIHFYYFLKEEEIPSKGWEIINSEAEKYKKSIKRIGHTICGQVGKRLYRVCFDFRVE